ncbi:MAG: hypothetical protein ACOZNI_15385 [Myxococcota bacterium]
MPLLLALLACGDSDDAGKDRPHDADADADTDADIDTDTGGPPVRPVVTGGDFYCYEHQTGETFWGWVAECSATDPQGTETLARGGAYTVLLDGAEAYAGLLACDPLTGECQTSFREDQTGVSCADASSYTIEIVVRDADGHESDTYAMTGRRQ